MQSPFCLVLVGVIVAMVTAEYDSDFCRKYIGKIDDNSEIGLKPIFYDNFYTFMEVKDIILRTTTYNEEYYSEEAEMIYRITKNQLNASQVWVDATTDVIMVGPLTNSVCLDVPLNDTDIGAALGIKISASGDVTLSRPQDALGWNEKNMQAQKYMGPSQARGIPTVKWMVCSYSPETEITSVTEWHIVDPHVMHLPVVPIVQTVGNSGMPVLPAYASVHGINKSNPLNVSEYFQSIDFTFFDTIQPNNSVFQIPTTMLCTTKPSAQKPLPTLPSFFRFKGEQMIIYDPNTPDATAPALTYVVEEYMQELNITVQDFITATSTGDTNDKSYIRTVKDFTMGITYNIDLETGLCFPTPIASDDVDSISVAGGKVKMRNSQQFFDLDSSQYQYMGIHQRRGIYCDTWSAYFTDNKANHQQNTLYTWYFANPQWMKKLGYYNTSQPLPISLEVQSLDEYLQFNIYEFDTLDGVITPDLTLCFTPNQTLNLAMRISATYSQIQAVSIDSFRRAFYQALLTQSPLNSIIRVSRVNVQPASSTDTLIQFRLFDTSGMSPGDVVNSQPGKSNSVIFSSLELLINAGSFSIDVPSYDDDGSPITVSFKAEPDSFGIFNAGQRSSNSSAIESTTPFNLQTGSSGYSAAIKSTTPSNLQTGSSGYSAAIKSTTPSNLQTGSSGYSAAIKSTTPSNLQTGSSGYSAAIKSTTPSNLQTGSSGYSAGTVAGIAIGMLILGILLASGAVFAIYRFRKSGHLPGIKNKKLYEESAT